MKKTGIALAILVAAGGLVVAGAAYTGTQLERTVHETLENANEQLQKTLTGSRIELDSLERGLFSSTARYRLVLDDPRDDKPAQDVLFIDHVEHGPFPLSRLKAAQLMPVMATSQFEMLRSPDVEPWFVATRGATPLSGQLTLSYNEALDGSVQFTPLKISENDGQIDFSGLTLNLSAGPNAESVQVSGTMDNLSVTARTDSLALAGLRIELQTLGADAESFKLDSHLKTAKISVKTDRQQLHARIEDATLRSEQTLGSAGLYLGQNAFNLARTELHTGDGAPLVILDLAFSDQTSEANNRLAGHANYSIGDVTYNGQGLGSSRMRLGFSNVDAGSVKQISEVISDYGLRMQTEPDAELSETDLQRLRDAWLGLLDGKPRVGIDELLLKTANGQSRLELQIDLAKPAQMDAPPAALAAELISKLRADLQISKPMIRDAYQSRAAFDEQADRQALALEAAQIAEMAGFMAVSSDLARIEGENIVANLDYANGQVELNGRKMSVMEFVGMLMGLGELGDAGIMGHNAR